MSAPMSLPSVPAPIAGEGFLHDSASDFSRQRRYSPPEPSRKSRIPALPASLTTMFPLGQPPPPPMIKLRVKVMFEKQLFKTPAGPCFSGRKAQLRCPPPAEVIPRVPIL